MPLDPTAGRAAQGRHHHRTAGLDRPSHLSRMCSRHGSLPPALNLRRLANQATVLLMASAALRPPAIAPARIAGSAPSAALLPLAMASDIEMGAMPPDPAAASQALLPPTAIARAGDAAMDLAAGTCAFAPRYCGTAMAVGGALAAAGGLATLGVMLLPGTARTAAGDEADGIGAAAPDAPYRVDFAAVDARIPPLRFNASELDPAHPPCQSLGGHVNARWEADTLLDRSRTRLGTFDQLRDRSLLIRRQLAEQMAARPSATGADTVIGDLWATGMDETRIESEGLAPLSALLAEIERLDGPAALFDHLCARAHAGRNPLFEFTALPDMDFPDTYMAYLAQAGLGLPDSAWYHDPARAPMLDAYQAHIVWTLALSGMPMQDAARAAEAIVALEKQLATASEPFSVLATDLSRYYNPVDIEQAALQVPGIDWQRFFAAQGLQTPPARFSLGMPGFFRTVHELLSSVPAHTWRAYLRFHALDAAAPCLSKPFVDAHTAFHGTALKGRRAEVPRWARVLDIIEHSAGDAFSPAYAQATYPPAIAQRVERIGRALSGALQRRLQDVPWMDPDTRAAAVRKAANLRMDIGGPKHWLPWDSVTTRTGSFLGNVEAADAYVHQRNIGLLGRSTDPDAWKLSAQTVDAYQDPMLNRIVIPAALLQPPLFDPDADDALNYGGIGVVLGHELAHGFDRIGGHFDLHGRLQSWWSSRDSERFDALATRLAEQFSRYAAAGMPIDGHLTLDENLADLGGLAIALEALKDVTRGMDDPMIDGMTREQRFFANFAFTWRSIYTPERVAFDLATDNHVPGRVRADGAPSNLPAFAAAFNCSEGDPMARPAAERVHFL